MPYQFLIFFVMMNYSSTMSTKSYSVHKVAPNQIHIDGTGSSLLWQKAPILSDFQYPWREELPPLTSFQALWDGEKLYLLYHAKDAEIITKIAGLGERDVVDSDRVEIFFKKDDAMDPYYALELDALGRILDTEGRFYRKIDFHWNWPTNHLIVRASQNEVGYTVEVSITLASLKKLGLWQEGQDYLHAGLYRGEYIYNTPNKPIVKWISWVKPDSKTPDFHIPSSFGKLLLLP